jgi:REP element-mobilizing transposase RayT
MHHRRSIRFKGFDYSSENSYFITLVTHERRDLFGTLANEEVALTGIGEIVLNNWLAIPEHFPDAELDEFVIMPNHLHGIINLFDADRRGTIYRAPTHDLQRLAPTEEPPPKMEQFGKPVRGSIPTIIRTFKASVTRDVRRLMDIEQIWQRNYYEHIIGIDKEYDEIVEYIHTNPQNWTKDDEYFP